MPPRLRPGIEDVIPLDGKYQSQVPGRSAPLNLMLKIVAPSGRNEKPWLYVNLLGVEAEKP